MVGKFWENVSSLGCGGQAREMQRCFVRQCDGAAIRKVDFDEVVGWHFVGAWAVYKNVVACGSSVGYG
jgi:hypothetical protein